MEEKITQLEGRSKDYPESSRDKDMKNVKEKLRHSSRMRKSDVYQAFKRKDARGTFEKGTFQDG